MDQPTDRRAAPGPWAAEATDVIRAASGGILLGVPLLYTMEVWFTGRHARPEQVLGVLAVTALPLYALNRTGGFRRRRDAHWLDAALDTVVALGIGLVLSFLVLVVLRELGPDTPVRAALGEVVYEALPFCLGIGLAHHVLAQGRDEDDAGDRTRDDDTGLDATVADLGATAVGAVVIALSIAPTDEVPVLASAMAPTWLLAVMVLSLVVSYGIVFVAGFVGQDRRHAQVGVLQRPITETVVAYLVALAASALMLAVFQRAEGPPSAFLGHVIVLGLPAAVGGAAGRLAS